MRQTSRWLLAVLLPACVLASLSGCSSQVEPPDADARVRVVLPDVILSGVPVASVRLEAVGPDGAVDTGSSATLKVKGLKIVTTGPEGTETVEPETVTLQEGTAEFETRLATGRRVYVSDGFSVEADGTRVTAQSRIVRGFWSLMPPVIAILFAIWLKDVYVALLAAVYSGSLVLAGWDPWQALKNLLDPGHHGILAQVSDSWNMQVVVFTLFLGAMIQVMSRSGGTQAFVHRLSGLTTTRERGQLLTWVMGLLVFFDDYANTMLVGGAMRPVTDRLRISREKLAFLIDSTAAPIAGLAIVSTWVGVEVGYIGDGFESLGMEKNISYVVFLKTIPFRFYPLFLIAFVFFVAATGRDFGPMLAAETEAIRGPELKPVSAEDGALQVANGSMWYAIVPVGVLVGWIVLGFVREFHSDDFDSVPLLLHASFGAALVGCVLAVVGRTLTIREAADAWVRGMTEMFPAVVVLVLAWSVSGICKPGGLNTAGFIIEQIGDGVAPQFMPTLAFVVSGVVAFSIGSSYTTMGLLIPLFMSLVGFMLASQGGVTSDDPLLLSTVGAILAGSIFGDHCSPISDTTVLSSAGAQCDHLRHVGTQMPYALTVGAVSIIFGYLPAGFGWNPWWMLVLGSIVCFVIVRLLGRRSVDLAEAACRSAEDPML